MPIKAFFNAKLTLIHMCLLLAVFTYSWEIEGWFRYRIAGFSLRLHQVFFLFPIAYYLFYCKKNISKIVLPLYVWVGFMFLFIPNSLDLKNAIGYAYLLGFSVLAMLCIIRFFNSENKIRTLLFTYIFGALSMSILVIIQFISFHLGKPIYEFQNPIMGILPRVGGFSFEPSAFTRYFIVPFVVTGYLLEKKTALFSKTFLRNSFVIMFIAFVLTTSRIGIMTALFYVFIRKISNVSRKNLLKNLTLISILILGFGFAYKNNEELISNLFKGINLIESIEKYGSFEAARSGGTSSSLERASVAYDAFYGFLESPIIGTSLGGVDPYYAKKQGNVYSPALNGLGGGERGGGSAFAAVLLASGMIALPFFIAFIFRIFVKLRKTIKRANYGHKTVLNALLWGMFFWMIFRVIIDGMHTTEVWIYLGIVIAGISVYGKQHNFSEVK
ncbi:MAG: O-antigen ligase family protein [Fibromonadaceae bacterium]|jgi:hypothetical protein|nr:O-antigen ligase family protein [Fibromonadaceae bacterium]